MSLISFLLFAFVASITPGPTNILVLTNSQHFDVKPEKLDDGAGRGWKAVNRIFRTTVAMVRFQRLMALCLLVSAWAAILA
ncbi:TPA: hypothetical protein ACOEDZ_003528 [Enterobacter asburiae]